MFVCYKPWVSSDNLLIFPEIGITFRESPSRVAMDRRCIYFEGIIHFRNSLDQKGKVTGYADVSLTGDFRLKGSNSIRVYI